MNHEFWNEIGNLYFMCGAYEPAINAYLRSIKLENTFGRSYSNLAMAYVQTGKYREAIKLYRRGIELLSDNREKAATWNRLGILYRQIKDYDNALEAYQRADLIMPQEEAEKSSESREPKLPLTVSLPELDLEAILAKGNPAIPPAKNSLLEEINAELEMAEEPLEEITFEEVISTPKFETYSVSDEAPVESLDDVKGDWKLEYAEENLCVEQDPEPADLIPVPTEMESLEIIVPIETQEELAANNALAIAEGEAKSVSAVEELDTFQDKVDFTEPAQNLQTGPTLSDLTPEEKQALDMEIIKYQQETSKNPRSYILWEGLGDAYKSAGQYREAIQAFQKAITMNPANAMCHYRLGLVFAVEQKEQEAIKCFKKVLELEPNSAQAHASLASQYRKMGQEDKAREHIEKARAMQPEEESDYNNACLEAICGNYDRALELLEVALQTKQTYVTWAQHDPDFFSLHNDQRFQTLLSAHAINA
jgi:tetratricopeptide (TPR) repeat protein